MKKVIVVTIAWEVNVISAKEKFQLRIIASGMQVVFLKKTLTENEIDYIRWLAGQGMIDKKVLKSIQEISRLTIAVIVRRNDEWMTEEDAGEDGQRSI